MSWSKPAETLHRDLSERNVDLLVARRLGRIADERQDFEFLFDDSYVVGGGRAKSDGLGGVGSSLPS